MLVEQTFLRDHVMSSSSNGHNPPLPLQSGVQFLQNWQDLAVESYKQNMNAAAACRAAGIARVTFYKYLKVDPHFAARIEQANQNAIDRLKESALRARGQRNRASQDLL